MEYYLARFQDSKYVDHLPRAFTKLDILELATFVTSSMYEYKALHKSVLSELIEIATD